MFIFVHLLSNGILDICFQWDGKLKNIHLFLHSIDKLLDLVSVRSQGGWGEQYLPLERDVGIHQK